MELLEKLISFFTEHDYLAVFLVLLICGMGVPIPEDITLVAGGVTSGLGYSNVHVMVGVGMAGVLLGDLMMFMIGRYYGESALRWRWVAFLVTPQRQELVQIKFERYGNWLLFIARFLPGLRSPIFIIAGWSRRVSVFQFLLLDGSAALLSVPFWVYLGYYGANNHDKLLAWVHRGQTGLWVGLVLLILAVLFWIWRNRRDAQLLAARHAQTAAKNPESRS